MTRPGNEETAPATGLGETPGDYGFPPGALIGRYVLGERLGAGGMGVVYAAHDPRLDRKVALKLLRPDASGNGDAHKQLVREAQTLARLAHPNVVNVHDIGEFEGRVYVDMELVKGATLAQWLSEGGRSWEQVLDVFIQAGRGLAAAHAVGIVHRDFKPDNVLVGDDGRVRVADFGIALLGPQPPRAGGDGGADAEADAGPETADGPTTASPVVGSHPRSIGKTGTPAYMAPEQRRLGAADARSDQYSYCVALHEAMFGERPRGKSAPRSATSKGLEPPAWLEQAIERGLRGAPEQRYASMDALLDVLVSEPRRRGQRRRAVATGAAAIALLAAGVVWGRVHDRASAPRLCGGAEAKLEGIWGEGRKAAIGRAFLATASPFSADAWRGAESTLDVYARDWVATRTDACEATRVRGEQSDQMLGLRMACLDERLAAMSALTDAFTNADRSIVVHAFGAAQGLPPVASCSDAKWLTASVKPPADPVLARRVAELRDRLARAMVMDELGKYKESLDVARAIDAEATQTGNAGVEASALYFEGSMKGRAGDLAGAEQTLRRAASTADAAGDDILRVRAWGALMYYAVGEGGKVELIPTFKEEAQSALARLGGDDRLEAGFLQDLSSAYLAAGKFTEACDAERRAAKIVERIVGKDGWREGVALMNLGIALATAEKGEEALDVTQRAVAIEEAKLGPAHPFIASGEATIAWALLELEKPALAEPHARRAVAIGEGTIDGDQFGRILSTLGDVLQAEGKLDEALAVSERALATMTTSHPGEDPVLRAPLVNLGEVYLDLGKADLAVPGLERAARLPLAGDDTDLARAQFALARALVASKGDRARARALAAQAKETLEKSGETPDEIKRLGEIKEWLGREKPGAPHG